MSVLKYETMDVVLDETLAEVCGHTKTSPTMTWTCVAPFHASNKHWYQRVS